MNQVGAKGPLPLFAGDRRATVWTAPQHPRRRACGRLQSSWNLGAQSQHLGLSRVSSSAAPFQMKREALVINIILLTT